MNIDELIVKIEPLVKDNYAGDILFILKDFKNNGKTVLELENTIEKFIDSYWPKESNGIEIFKFLNEFKNTSIKNIGGMTMNERLFSFSLFNRFDSCKSDKKREIIYKKLLANKIWKRIFLKNGTNIILGRSGLKYIDENGIEYFIDSEMIIDKKYDFVLFSNTIKLFEDYLKEGNSENKIVSNITKEKQNIILKRIVELSKGKIKIQWKRGKVT